MPKPMPQRPAPNPQAGLPLVLPPPTDTDPRVAVALRQIWLHSPPLHRRYGSLEAALADPQGRSLMTLCARGAVAARQRQAQHRR